MWKFRKIQTTACKTQNYINTIIEIYKNKIYILLLGAAETKVTIKRVCLLKTTTTTKNE